MKKGSGSDSQYAAYNREHAARNSSGGDSPVGGGQKFSLPGPHAKSFPNTNDTAPLKKLGAGRPDVAKGKNVR